MDNLEQERLKMLDDELRPDLSAEAFSPRMRNGLLLLVMVAEGVLVLVTFATAFWPQGLLGASPLAAAMAFGLGLALIWFLLVIFGGLVSNNPRLTPAARNAWLASFLLAGPFTLPAYWLMHLRSAPYLPWTPPHDAHPAASAQLTTPRHSFV